MVFKEWISRIWGVTALVISLGMTGASAAGGAALDNLPDDPREKARVLMNVVDDLWRGESSRARMTMSVKTAHWERTMTLMAWSLGKDYSLVRIVKPKKESGTTTLKHGTDIYNYLPKTDRTIKISSGMMMGSWMGSHFTNDDLVKESRYSEDYNVSVIFDGARDGRNIWEIQLDPKPDAAVVWGKIVFVIDKDSILPVVSRYFDEEGELVRTMSFHDERVMGQRTLPVKMRLVPADAPDEFTECIYEEIDFDIELTPDYFSLRNLKSQGGEEP